MCRGTSEFTAILKVTCTRSRVPSDPVHAGGSTESLDEGVSLLGGRASASIKRLPVNFQRFSK